MSKLSPSGANNQNSSDSDEKNNQTLKIADQDFNNIEATQE